MIRVSIMDVTREGRKVTARAKRTYNLSAETVRRVRELASEYRVAASQDGVVELAVDRLFREAVDRAEAGQWAEAAHDPAFRAEAVEIAAAFGDAGRWPK